MIYYNYPPYSYSSTSRNPNIKYPNYQPMPNPMNSWYRPYSKNKGTAGNPSYDRQKEEKNIRNHSKNQNSPKETTSKETSRKPSDDAFFEILGIKLYFDDILLICLIFFLYNEGVQDQYLFIALVLLLLS